MSERIPLAKPVIGDRERELVDEVLRSGQLSLGPMVPRFERDWAERIGVQPRRRRARAAPPACTCACTRSGSGRATRSSPRRSRSWPRPTRSSSPARRRCSPRSTRSRSTWTRRRSRRPSRPRTKAILIVDIFGYPAEVPALVDIADRHGLAPASRTPASRSTATYDGRKLGTFGHPAVYGFYANKQLTTAEGGVVLTDDDDLAQDAQEPAQPGPLRRRRVARPLPPRLQLPPLGRAQRDRRRPARAPRPTCSPAARASPAGTRRASPRSTA